MAYLLGENPLRSSYMMGFGSRYESHPHHAAGHVFIYGEPDQPAENRHVVWGALVNGPSDGNDGHHDVRSDFGATEITIDWSYDALTSTSTKSPHIPVYLNGTLVFGVEPACEDEAPERLETPIK